MSNVIDSNSRFAINPTQISSIQRSKFDLSHRIKTTFNVGELVPFDILEVLPADSHNLETNILARLQTLITPMMDDLYLDVFYFFVPNRLVWEHWKNMMGENTQSSWYPVTSYTCPTISIPSNADLSRSILDYMGVPTNVIDSDKGTVLNVNAMPVRAYNLIWNEWFRDQNLQDPILVSVNDSTVEYDKSLSYTGGNLLKVNKYHDYFTSCLPSPQKGPDVTIPMQSSTDFPVFAKDSLIPEDLRGNIMRYDLIPNNGEPTFSPYGAPALDTKGQLAWTNNPVTVTTLRGYATPNNLWSNVEGLPVATINQLRLAFATQQLYELDARGGTRYVEILKSHFGVTSPDARQQRPELLSYAHIPVNVNQVVQQSATAQTSPLGNVAGLSVTADSDNSFVKSFTEHGYIIGLCCARYKHSYQQGLNRLWSRQSRFDFFWPVFANVGEQPVLNKEIFVDYNLVLEKDKINKNDEVFGYQEAWAEYRYIPDRVSSEMRSDYPQSLDVWHLADDYTVLPSLSSEWISEDPETVNRVLAVSDNISAQIFMDIYVKLESTRPMPVYSIPGLTRM